ncbi:hypothetical protein OSJ17_21895, partial [Mycobacterium ulcerans]
MPVVAVPTPPLPPFPPKPMSNAARPAVAAGAAGISAAVGSSRAAGPAVADQQARVTAIPTPPCAPRRSDSHG